ncbi:MAG: exopolysaccharide biosynthesis polyprenyl glycosylphosphotransferase [Oscillospiraceae bacterium]|nr:exopolysaccharide biosynthesis polyprenyl glycosylphosphotransferase [Oscillospiraceae bacterium]
MESKKNTHNSFKHSLLLRVIKLLNLVAISGVFALIWYSYYADSLYRNFFRKGNWVVILLYAVLYFTYGRVYEAFHISQNRISEIAGSQITALALTNGIMILLTWILMRRFYSLWPYVLCFAVQCLLCTVWAYLTNHWYFKRYPPMKTVVVEGNDMKNIKNIVEAHGLSRKYDVIRTVTVEDLEREGTGPLEDAEAVFLVGLHSHDRNQILKYCIDSDIRAFIKPRLGDVIMNGATEVHMMNLPILRVVRYRPTPEYLMLKRVFDLVSALVVLILTSPIFLIVSILIKAQDKGPVFYKQKRLTLDGKQFELIKFRSMRVDAEADGIARLSTGDRDSRITPVGRVIRKVRIDELPQLINIIKGDMSVVGPRPERPEIAEEYEKELPEFRLRLQAKAGLTGYAQVYGKYNTTPYDKLCMDLIYIAHPSFIQDLKLIFATIWILFRPESTEGFKGEDGVKV